MADTSEDSQDQASSLAIATSYSDYIPGHDQIVLMTYMNKLETMSSQDFEDIDENDKKILSKYIEAENKILNSTTAYHIVQ
jgi:hypothetical protein